MASKFLTGVIVLPSVALVADFGEVNGHVVAELVDEEVGPDGLERLSDGACENPLRGRWLCGASLVILVGRTKTRTQNVC